MDRKEELQRIIDDAQSELDQLAIEEPELLEELPEGIESASDYQYWKGRSLLGIDIEKGKFLNWNEAKHTVNLSFCEMDSSQEMDLRIIRQWKQEPVIERGKVTHFRKMDVVEKRYTWDWELVR